MADQVTLLDAQSNSLSHITLLRDQVTATKVRLFGSPFTGPGLNSGADFASGTFPEATTDAGSGTGGIVAGQLEMRTGATPGSSTLLRSNVLAYFVTGSVTGFESGIQVPATPATFSVVSLKAGVPTPVLSSAFSVVPNAVTDGDQHRYSMEFAGSEVVFYRDSIALHRMSGNVTTQRTDTLDLPLTYDLVNTAGTTTVRWGMFSATDGYYFQATYATTDVTMNVRGSSALQFGPIALVSGNVVSQSNSTTTPLGASATFTGVTENVLPYQDIDLSVAGSLVAPGTLFFEFSPDGVNWDISKSFALATPNFSIAKPLRVILPWFRVRYVNGATPQTTFRLTTLLHRLSASPLARFPAQVPDDEEPLAVTKAILAASDGAGAYPNVTATTVGPAKALDVAVKVSALPANAATETTLAGIDATLDVPLSSRASEVTLADIDAIINASLNTTLSSRASEFTVSGLLTDAQLRATPVPVSGTVTTGGLTDTQLRASPVPVSGTVSTGGLTDTQLRAAPVPVSGTVTATGPLTDTQLRATPVPVSGPLTDTQLRATPVPVSGTVTTGGLTDTQLRATPVPVSGPLTDTQLRATPVPVSDAALDVALSTRAADTTLTGGTAKAIVRGGAKGVTVPTDVTSTSIDADHQALDIAIAATTATLNNGTEVAVSSAAIQVVASNTSRKAVVLQNTGIANVRIGAAGVTPTTGFRLIAGGDVTIEMPWGPTQALFAIREGTVDSIVLGMEIT